MIQLFQDFTQLAVEGKYHNFDWPAAWAKKVSRTRAQAGHPSPRPRRMGIDLMP